MILKFNFKTEGYISFRNFLGRDRRERSWQAFPMRKSCLKIHRNARTEQVTCYRIPDFLLGTDQFLGFQWFSNTCLLIRKACRERSRRSLVPGDRRLSTHWNIDKKYVLLQQDCQIAKECFHKSRSVLDSLELVKRFYSNHMVWTSPELRVQ